MVRVATIVLELNGTHKRARRLVVLPALALGCAQCQQPADLRSSVFDWIGNGCRRLHNGAVPYTPFIQDIAECHQQITASWKRRSVKSPAQLSGLDGIGRRLE